jgi:5S rRNA maturation endonuclease (ribonuclease M5)
MYREGDIEGALLRLGIEVNQRNNELLGLCPMHLERTGRPDSNPSWSMNVETGVHHCFSCGYRGTLLTLVAEIKEYMTIWNRLDFDAAKEWLRSNIEVNFELLAKQLEEAKNSYVAVQRPIEMSEARLAVFTSPPKWALDARGLTKEACALHSVLWDNSKEGWITPIRNSDNKKLMGWQEKGQKTRYFRNRPTGVQKSKTLFGLDVWEGGTMIIVESPLDTVKLSSLGIKGGISTFGASISDEQFSLMRMADKLIFAFDNDAAGKTANLDVLARVRSGGMECWFTKYEDDQYKDIGDMPENTVQLLLENIKHSVFGGVSI